MHEEEGASLAVDSQDVNHNTFDVQVHKSRSRIQHTFVKADEIRPNGAGESAAELVGTPTLDSRALTVERPFF